MLISSFPVILKANKVTINISKDMPKHRQLHVLLDRSPL